MEKFGKSCDCLDLGIECFHKNFYYDYTFKKKKHINQEFHIINERPISLAK